VEADVADMTESTLQLIERESSMKLVCFCASTEAVRSPSLGEALMQQLVLHSERFLVQRKPWWAQRKPQHGNDGGGASLLSLPSQHHWSCASSHPLLSKRLLLLLRALETGVRESECCAQGAVSSGLPALLEALLLTEPRSYVADATIVQCLQATASHSSTACAPLRGTQTLTLLLKRLASASEAAAMSFRCAENELLVSFYLHTIATYREGRDLLLRNELLCTTLVAASHREDPSESVAQRALVTLRLLARHAHRFRGDETSHGADGSMTVGNGAHGSRGTSDSSDTDHSSDELGTGKADCAPSAFADALADMVLSIGDSPDSFALQRQAAAALTAIHRLPADPP